MNEDICPFCGASSYIMCSFDGYDYHCGTWVSTMRMEPVYHQSDRCKENVKRRGDEND